MKLTATGAESLATLRRFVHGARKPEERCELCSTALAPQHRHLFELEHHRVTCACEACALLFGGDARQRYRLIPRDVRRLAGFAMDDHEWESLLLPINLAFFVHSSAAGRVVALYPSPGGVMESALDLQYWNAIAARNPVLAVFEPDVEALLVNRLSSAPQYYRAPLDCCYRLVGLLRTHWRGLSGGDEVWRQIDHFFAELAQCAEAVQPSHSAQQGRQERACRP
jgi:hypothetical protein